MIRWVRIIEDFPVEPPPGLVYSTAPRVGTDSHGQEYFVKGPDPLVVQAEALAYNLADIVGLDVPRWALSEVPRAGIAFVSRAAPLRSGVDAMIRGGRICNPEMLATCCLFDLWIANHDRNVSNLVIDSDPDGRPRVLAIDFEKAMVLRAVDLFTVTGVPPDRFMPRELLRSLMRGAVFPRKACAALRDTPADEIRHVVHETFAALARGSQDAERITDQLLLRRAAAEAQLQEAWVCLK